MLVDILIIGLLILLSGFFSSSETGVTASSKAQIFKYKDKFAKRVKSAFKLKENKQKFISLVLLCNNIVNTLAAAIMTQIMLEHFPEYGVYYATIIITVLLLIFAEVIPKTYAIYNAEKVTLFVAPIFNIITKILYPIIILTDFTVSLFLKIFNIKDKTIQDKKSVHDNLKNTIDMHYKDGIVIEEDKKMLGGLLDLSEIDVRDIMVHRTKIITIDINQDINDIVENIINKCNHTRIPIWENDPDNIIGLLNIKDLIKYPQPYTKEIIKEAMSKPWFIPETTSVKLQLRAFLNRKQHFSFVVDEYGVVQGIVTLEDILEEIVGEIIDEFDNKNEGKKLLKIPGEDYYSVDGWCNIRDINRELGVAISNDIASTISGLITNKIERIPEEGEYFYFENLEMIILDKSDNQINKIKIRKYKKEDDHV